MEKSKIYFQGDFNQKYLKTLFDSCVNDSIEAIFGKDVPKASENTDFIFTKHDDGFEILSYDLQHPIKIDTKNQKSEDAIITLINALYGNVYVGIDWYCINSALSSESGCCTYIGGIQVKSLHEIKPYCKNASGIFFNVLAPENTTLDEIQKIADELAFLCEPDADIVWTLSFCPDIADCRIDAFIGGKKSND